MKKLLYCFIPFVLFSCQSHTSGIPEPTIVDVDGGDNPVLGDANAPITLIAFSDFECSYCKLFYERIEGIKKDYIETGKVKYVYRDYPLEKHEQATPAAACAHCAGEQGKYWEMYRLLYENQEDLEAANYVRWAVSLGLNEDAFVKCMESTSTHDNIQADYNKGEEIGVGGTPTFIINNEMYGGVPPEDTFRKMLDLAIEKVGVN